jgi:hypothetical protein
VLKSAYWFPPLIDASSDSIFEPTLAYVLYKTGNWDSDSKQALVENCLNAQRNCAVRSLGDGDVPLEV